MSQVQIAVQFSVETDHDGVTHITYRSMLTPLGPERVGGKYLPQYSGRRHEMETKAAELQRNYDQARGA